MYGSRESVFPRVLLALVALAGVALVAVIAFNAGAAHGGVADTAAAGARDWRWHGGPGFGLWFLFPLGFGLLFFVLLFGLVRAAFFGFGPRNGGPWGSGPAGGWDDGPGAGRRDALRRGFDEWHREAHRDATSAVPPPSTAASESAPGPADRPAASGGEPGGER